LFRKKGNLSVCFFPSTEVHAAITINSVTLDGGNSVTVASSATISANIGRFTPDHFITSIANNGMLQDSCSGFTYSGQIFSYVSSNFPEILVIATDSFGNTTVNYREGFVKLTDPATQISMPAVTAAAGNLGADLVHLLNLIWTPTVLDLLLSNFQENLTSLDTSASGSGILLSGIGNNLSLSVPGVGNDGSVDLTLNLSQATGADMEWLQPGGNNPTAKATFGIFKGNQRLIYMRESVW
jgi:hypothetical protein